MNKVRLPRGRPSRELSILIPEERQFVQAYLADRSPVRAAMAIGYPMPAAVRVGCTILSREHVLLAIASKLLTCERDAFRAEHGLDDPEPEPAPSFEDRIDAVREGLAAAREANEPAELVIVRRKAAHA